MSKGCHKPSKRIRAKSRYNVKKTLETEILPRECQGSDQTNVWVSLPTYFAGTHMKTDTHNYPLVSRSSNTVEALGYWKQSQKWFHGEGLQEVQTSVVGFKNALCCYIYPHVQLRNRMESYAREADPTVLVASASAARKCTCTLAPKRFQNPPKATLYFFGPQTP